MAFLHTQERSILFLIGVKLWEKKKHLIETIDRCDVIDEFSPLQSRQEFSTFSLFFHATRGKNFLITLKRILDEKFLNHSNISRYK